MSFTPTVFSDGIAPGISASELNKLGNGLQAAAAVADAADTVALAAIPKPAGPGANTGLVWNGSAWVAQTIKDAQIDAAAAIAYSKLSLGSSIKNTDISLDGNGLAVGAFSAFLSSAQTPTHATDVVVLMDGEDFDVSGWHDTATNKGRYTPLLKGYYRLSAALRYNAAGFTANSRIIFSLRKNGAVIKQLAVVYSTTAGDIGVAGSAIVLANGTTDFFEVSIRQDDTIDRALQVGSSSTYWCGELIGRAT